MANKKKPNKPSNQSKKRKKKSKGQKDGHFCWVCGEHKVHEKFSGRGHATHMCKQCHSLPVGERNEMVATRKAENMAFRYLNEQEIKWLRKRMNDPRPEVRDAAREAHRIKFPHYERNKMKKGLTACSLEFYINDVLWDEYGDEIPVRMRFIMPDNSGILRRINYNAPENEQETSINIGKPEAKKFLKAVVSQLNAPFWSEDLSDASSDDYGYDFPFDEDEENFDWVLYVDGEEDEDSEQATTEDREPIWSLELYLTNGLGERVQTFYNQMHEEPQELFWLLMEWFGPSDEDDDFDQNIEFE